MIANLRPTKPESLNTIVEEFETRFPEEDVQQKIVDVIIEALGSPDGSAERQAMVRLSRLVSQWHISHVPKGIAIIRDIANLALLRPTTPTKLGKTRRMLWKRKGRGIKKWKMEYKKLEMI